MKTNRQLCEELAAQLWVLKSLGGNVDIAIDRWIENNPTGTYTNHDAIISEMIRLAVES